LKEGIRTFNVRGASDTSLIMKGGGKRAISSSEMKRERWAATLEFITRRREWVCWEFLREKGRSAF